MNGLSLGNSTSRKLVSLGTTSRPRDDSSAVIHKFECKEDNSLEFYLDVGDQKVHMVLDSVGTGGPTNLGGEGDNGAITFFDGSSATQYSTFGYEPGSPPVPVYADGGDTMVYYQYEWSNEGIVRGRAELTKLVKIDSTQFTDSPVQDASITVDFYGECTF